MHTSEIDASTDIVRPRLLLRLEGAAVLMAGIAVYSQLDVTWWLFVALCLAPDIAFLGLPFGKRIGTFAYNTLHTYILPALLAIAGLALDENLVVAIAVIWAAHIGMDRMIGYGLKYAGGDFKETHIQRA
jgi:hypothetical protein